MAKHIPPTVLGLLVVGNWHKMAATVLEGTKRIINVTCKALICTCVHYHDCIVQLS